MLPLSAVARTIVVLAALAGTASAQQQPPRQQQPARPLKVFVSVDMEGLAGVVANTEISQTGPDYAHFRRIMAGEASAAVDGAFRAGATEVVVRDSHGDKRNMLPADVDPRARLLRGASTGPKNMMEGIDSTFDAVVFVGYHARAGTPRAILEHTSNGNVVDLAINGVSLPEGGYNALTAGLVGVPVVFVSGDRAVVDQLRALLGPIVGVAVKEEMADAVLGLSPTRAQEEIRRGVEQAVRERARSRPYRMPGPYTMTLKVKQERPLHPGARKVGTGEFSFASPDLLAVLDAFNAMK